MQPAEELVLQQLLQMQFWQKLHPENIAPQPASAQEAKSPALPALPAVWELTRGVVLHSWQKRCVDAWFDAGRRGVIKVVTGAGKTVLALAIAERLQREQMRNCFPGAICPRRPSA